MPRYRLRYAKRWAARFLSHLDMVRLFERALRRAAWPVSLTGGFNRRPKMVFAAALPVGLTSTAEYVDVWVEEAIEPGGALAVLNASLPPGVEVLALAPVPEGRANLMAAVRAARYLFAWPTGGEELARRWLALERRPRWCVVRRTKKALRTIDIKPLVYEAHLARRGSSGILKLTVASGQESNVRPGEVVELLVECGEGGFPEPFCIHRLELFIERGGRLVTPLET